MKKALTHAWLVSQPASQSIPSSSSTATLLGARFLPWSVPLLLVLLVQIELHEEPGLTTNTTSYPLLRVPPPSFLLLATKPVRYSEQQLQDFLAQG